ncbi:PEP-CTERM sorting domain-containing protein [Pseudoduganella sp. LjRoot289]|uniref:PEP-CTERM sorting domain-containing protein n=1 Tax=Pseudoduganella sp. LjRoot289 TaxID=3342314 RepID=UPI003ECDE12B
MKSRIRETLARAAIMAATTMGVAAAAAGGAHATTLPLQDASITATYNGSAAMLGFDNGYSVSAGGNTTKLDPDAITAEFLSADAVFGFDFGADGSLSIYNNSGFAVAPGDYRFRFDFTSLASPITSFKLLDASAVGGLPLFSILDGGRALGVDLSALTWSGDFLPVTASIEAAQAGAVPEPGTMSVLLAGVGAIALVRRRKPRA